MNHLNRMKIKLSNIYTYEEWEQYHIILKQSFFPNSWYNEYVSDDKIRKIILLNNQPIGACEIEIKENYAQINLLAIKESYRGRGLGNKFIQELFHYFRYKRINTLKLKAEENLLEFYKKNGFKVNSYKKGYYVLEKKLSFSKIKSKIYLFART